MKRLLLAAVLAVAVHALLVSTHFTWLEKPRPGVSDREPLALSLEARVSTTTAAQPNTVSRLTPSGSTPAILPDESSVSAPQQRHTRADETQSAEARIAKRVTHKKPATTDKQPEHAEVSPPPATKAPRRDEDAAQLNKTAQSVSRKTAPNSVSQSNALTAAPAVAEFRQAVPIYKENPPPIYPRIARLRGYEGTVMLDVLVGSDGRVSERRIIESSGHGILDEAALSSVQDWRFEPARQGPGKVSTWVTIPFRFQLR